MNINYISGGLYLFGAIHTKEQLAAILNQLVVCGYLTHEPEGYRIIENDVKIN